MIRSKGGAVIIGGAFWTPGATVVGGAIPSFETVMKKLFANSEQGFWYDPNDLSTMYQDAAGTIPVTGAGQSVGLMLDKSKGVALGNELVTNGSFDNGTTGWVAEYQSALSNVGGKLRVTATGINPYGVQAISGLTVGKTYKLTYAPFVKTGTGAWVINLGNKAGGYQAQYGVVREPALAVGGSFIFTATTTVLNIALVGGVGTVVGDYADFDNISVKEIVGNHAYQTNPTSRPILRQNAVTDAYYLEFDGADDFLLTGNIDFTATDKVSLFAGVRKLSDAVGTVVTELSNSITNVGTFSLQAPIISATGTYGARLNGNVVSGFVSAIALNNYPSPASNILTAKMDISAQDLKEVTFRVNAANTVYNSTPLAGTGNYGNYPLYIGRRGGTQLPFNGHIYGLIGIGKLTTNDETAVIEKELAKQVGVTLNV